MEDAKREILSRVAAGALTPEQGMAQLEELEREQRSSGRGPATAAAEEQAGAPLSRIRVEGRLDRVRIVGDSSVREAVAEGPHQARREGEVLVIRAHGPDDLFGFSFGRRGPWGGLGRHWGNEAWGPFNWGQPWMGQELRIAMNPDLGLDVELLAGNLVVTGVRGKVRAQMTAGSARLDGLEGPIDLHVASGSVRASGILRGGTSRIRCEMGSVALRLGPGSSVAITARATMGRVSLPGIPPPRSVGWGLSTEPQSAIIGAGEGTLDVESNMGSVSIEAEG